MDNDPVTDKGVGHGGVGADIAIAADMDPVADNSAGGDGGAAPNRGLGADHGAGLDLDPLLQTRGSGDAATLAEAAIRGGLRLQGIRIEQRQDLGEAPIRLGRDQGHGVGRCLACEFRSDETGGGGRLGEQRQIFRIVEEGEVPFACGIEGFHVLDGRIEIDVAGGRGAGGINHGAQREGAGALEKAWMFHQILTRQEIASPSNGAAREPWQAL